MWEGVGDRTELQHIDPHSIGHNRVSFPFSRGCSTGAWGPSLSGCWFSLPHLITNSSDSQLQLLNWGPEGWLCWVLAFSTTSLLPLVWSPNCTDLYNSSTHTFLWASQIALIQPIHGQGYILLFLDRMHLLFTLVHFLFWQPDRVVGQYTTLCLYTVGFIWPINRTLSGATTSNQSGPWSNGNERVLCIPKAGSSPSDGLMSFLEHSLGGLTPV